MRRAWLVVLLAGLVAWTPVLGQEPQSGAAAPAAAITEGGTAPEAAVESAPADLAAALPPELPPPVVLPVPVEAEVMDVPNDNGSGLGVAWRWQGAVNDNTTFMVQAEVPSSMLEQYRLTADEQQRLDSARQEFVSTIAGLVGPRDAADAEYQELDAQVTLAQNNHDPEFLRLLDEKWAAQNKRDALDKQINDFRDLYMSKVAKLHEKDIQYRYLEATLNQSPWLDTSPQPNEAAAALTKADFPNRFGFDPAEPDKLYTEVSQIVAFNPEVFAGTYDGQKKNEFDEVPEAAITLEMTKNEVHNLRMAVSESTGEGAAAQVVSETTDLGGAKSIVNFFNFAVINNLIFAVLFAAIILTAIVIARRNPNLFIRRINGLEAVDEAIGRATEMGKPVLYLTGMDALSSLSTLAAVNILGRVARRIADYDSDLLVPCRDPVTLTVAQEVVREAYTDIGRPDAYRQDNLFFVTDDQFAFTAATCAIMIRDKPAANFFMGYYYAESLLLAETGASTGAIQIAGTDSTSQLPFFIVTCDYTLIGEELYAASAYLSREPMLLGSLKGQDLGKAMMMILIIIQTLLFLFSSEFDFLKKVVEPL
jgi:hypothetical protein